MTLIHEDEELDEMRGFDGENFPAIYALDEDHNDIKDEDLFFFVFFFCDLVMDFICESMKLLVWLTLFVIS